MTREEELANVKRELAEQRAENVRLQVENAQLREQLEQVLARLAVVEGHLAKDSQNSSKPPSSAGPARKTASQRKPSGKKSGGQPGHAGQTLKLVDQPDLVIKHRPSQCEYCQQSLEGIAGEVIERRQVQELPPLRLVVSEHQLEQVTCPDCQQISRGTFPIEVPATTQYGPGVRALAVYLNQYQLVPSERTCEALSDLCGRELSEGTLARWVEQAAQTLEETVTRIAEWIRASRVQHANQTGVSLFGILHWMHVNSTRWLTHLAWHAKRGYEA